MTHVLILDTLMAHAYERRKDADGFLYITYTDETTLGTMEQWWLSIKIIIYF